MAHYVYVIGPDNGPYKIGMTNNADRRLAEIQAANAYPVSIHNALKVPESHCRLIELFAHLILAEHRTHGEWFDVPLTRINKLFKVILHDNGYRALEYVPLFEKLGVGASINTAEKFDELAERQKERYLIEKQKYLAFSALQSFREYAQEYVDGTRELEMTRAEREARFSKKN